MSPLRLLSLLCLSLLFLSLVQLTRAGGELRVNESLTKILLEKQLANVLLAVENSSGQARNARVQLELLDPQNHIRSQTSGVQRVRAGNQTLKFSLPLSQSYLKDRQLLWYRLHYRFSVEGSATAADNEGTLSLSQITPELFELRVATTQIAREGARYHARVQAIHPITRQPAPNVRIDGEITLDENSKNSVGLHAAKTTDARGYAVLEFVLPARLPHFPHTAQATGDLHLTSTRNGFVAEAKAEFLVDQSARTLISSDKPLYQPGQVLHLRALILSPSKRALANQNILIRICDPEDTTVFRTVVSSSRFGIAVADWLIPENVRLGDYRIWVSVDGEDQSGETAHDVRISRYELPNFSVSVEPDRSYYLPRENAEVRVRADYVFGKPVARGHVRVVPETEREWNYREQKWDIEEGEAYEGETDAGGSFVACINLAKDHGDLSDEDYQRFEDITYAAYFTDPTTNRTEQRRFDLRVTREPIHVYVIETSSNQHRDQPLKFYLSTFYADGSPARCKVNVTIADSSSPRRQQATHAPKRVATLRTNRYGLAKVSGVRLPREFADKSYVDLVVSAGDSKGRTGSKTENISIESEERVVVETDKTLYHGGEPIVAYITSTIPDANVVVDLVQAASVMRSERVQLLHSRAAVTFAYKPEFKDRLTIAAYTDFPEYERLIGTRTVLYPRNPNLKVNLKTSQASYRPGETAHVNLSVRAPEGNSVESALGVVVTDKAVDERFRTDRQFGQHFYTFNETLQRFLGLDEQVAGVSFRDLQRLDMTKAVSPDLQLLAEILLNQGRDYYPTFYGGDQYETEQLRVFSAAVNEQIKPIREALQSLYLRTGEYPNDGASLRRLLLKSEIDFDQLHDPWGVKYRADFFIDRQSDVLTLMSAGADKRFETGDDFSVEWLGWPYFVPLGGTIDRAIRNYHERTGGYIRDVAALRQELAREGLTLDEVRDRWGRPYRFEFGIEGSYYVLRIRSGGPDKKFSLDPQYPEDDFPIWESSIDYFAEHRARLQAALSQSLKNAKRFPQADRELREALRNSGEQFEDLRDPWGRRYDATFKTQSFYGDHVRVENRANFGEPATTRTQITPVTKIVGFVTIRSVGPDAKEGTADDFTVATFTEVISEQESPKSGPQVVSPAVVLSASNGAIHGVVTDAQGASIPGTVVRAKRFGDEQSVYESSSNEEGKYIIGDLPPGLYEVRFEARGFMVTVVTEVIVHAWNLTEVNARLQPGTVTETVTVTSDVADFSVNATRATLSHNVNVVTKSGASQQLATPRLRQYFPETLVWQPAIETDRQGRAQLDFRLADNITTWKMAVIGSTEDGRIGTAELDIRAFQPFFVEHDPPRVLTEGDEISLPVVVRNYLERPQTVNLEMKPESWFSLLGPARKQTAVLAGDAARETFSFRATSSLKDGKQRITASGGDANDSIEKPITVHPDGEELSVTAGDILSSSATLELNVAVSMIPNSHRGELKIYPNLLAHVMESVEAIMTRPYGS